MGLHKIISDVARQGPSALRRSWFQHTNIDSNNPKNSQKGDIQLQDASEFNNYNISNEEVNATNNQRLKISSNKQYSKKFNLFSFVGIGCILFLASVMLFRDYTGADIARCRSIYMYPSYARIDSFDIRFTPLAQKYHLYLYREQGKDKEPLHEDTLQLDGIPVLFVPGNRGSFRQVRSIAAACSDIFFDSRDSILNENTQNVDFFTADFNEDFTAFHGQTMLDQAEYLNDAIAYILSLYEQSNNASRDPLPESVIIVAHSMGGIVARVMPTLNNHPLGSVNSMITLSSPHAASPVSFDGDILKLYKRTNDYWRQQLDDEDSFFSRNVSLISITGSVQDTVLPADYAAVQDLLPLKNGFTTFTTTVPGVWTPIDHLAVVWCKQLRLVIAKLILEIVDSSQPYKTKPLEDRISLSKRLLLSGLEGYSKENKKTVTLSRNTRYEEIIESNNYNTLFQNEVLILNVANTQLNSRNLTLIDISENLSDNSEFVFLTTSSTCEISICKLQNSKLNCNSITDKLLSIPRSFKSSTFAADSSLEEGSKSFLLYSISKEELANYDSIIIQEAEVNNYEVQDEFLYASLSESSFNKKFEYSPLHMYLYGMNTEISSNDTISEHTLTFPKLWDSLISYSVKVVSKARIENDLLFEPLLRQWIDTPFETKWFVNILKNNNIDINMHNVSPYIPTNETESHPLHLSLLLPPNVSITMSLQINWLLTLKMLFIRYRLAIGSIPIFFISVVLAVQFYWYSKSDRFLSFPKAMSLILEKTWKWMLLILLILTPIVNIKTIQHILYFLDPVSLNRPFALENRKMFTNFYFLGIREWFSAWIGLLFGFISIGLIYIICYTIAILEAILIKISSKFCKCAAQSNEDILVVTQLFDRKRIFAITTLLIAVMFYIPYQLAYVIAALIQIGTCIKLVFHRNELEKSRRREYFNLLNYNISLLILMLMVTIINTPIIIVFLHNVAIKWETTFRSHHNFIAVAPIILLVSSNSMLNIPVFPKQSYDWFITIGLFSYLAFFSLIYGTKNLYFIHDIVNIIFGWLFFGSVINYVTGQMVHATN